MSKCCYCNRELTSGDNPSKLGLCSKCYDDLFRNYEYIPSDNKDTIIKHLKQELNNAYKIIIDKNNKITELKQKVEEANSERHEEWLTGKEWKWECDRLKRQLENAIIPKFKIGQEVYSPNKYNYQVYKLKIISIHIMKHKNTKYNSLSYMATRLKDDSIFGYLEEELFNTKEEAEAKLKEITKSE